MKFKVGDIVYCWRWPNEGALLITGTAPDTSRQPVYYVKGLSVLHSQGSVFEDDIRYVPDANNILKDML